MNLDEIALKIIHEWESGIYKCETQRKACLQECIVEALEKLIKGDNNASN